VGINKKNNELVTDTSPFINSDEAVTVTTAHGAKGLEFDAVILVAAVEDTWADSKRHRRIRFPENLPVAYEGDTKDDYIRLLYVAMTRARHHLHAVSFAVDDDGDEQVELSFLDDTDLETRSHDDLPDTTTLLESTTPEITAGPYVGDEKDLLLPLLEEYETRGLSVTHLNNFLDVRYGGPQNFLSSNLLRFPQPKSKRLVYGSAIHETLERVYKHIKANDSRPDTETVLAWFKEHITTSRIDETTKVHLLERGQDNLRTFYEERQDTFSAEHWSEYSFGQEGVVIEDVPITGKIDKLVPTADNKLVVHDFKTGSSFDRFSNYYAKSLQYARQLTFYKLLVENSQNFSDKKVDTGVIEFVEPDDGEITILEKDITADETSRLEKLVAVVYEHIMNLDFPDVSDYSEDAKGIRAFRDDLLKDKI
jgi:DNA helicase-2/ATP-dependent DNA helicase PcrA